MAHISFTGPRRGLGTELAIRGFGYQVTWRPRSREDWTKLVQSKFPGRRVLWLGPLGHIDYGHIVDLP